jgi:hypothetical protein
VDPRIIQNAPVQTEVYASERASANGSWSTPTRLTATAPGFSTGAPQAAVGRDGAASVVWSESTATGVSVRSVAKATGSEPWTAAQTVTDPTTRHSAPKVAVTEDNTFVLVWTQAATAESQALLLSAQRKATDTDWSPAETITSSVKGLNTSAPLIGPNGDVTLVWSDDSDGHALRTATRSTGTWSPVATLTTEYVRVLLGFDANIGSDGTVQAGWVQRETDEAGRVHQVFLTAARVNGSWTPAKKLSNAPASYSEGVVAVGSDGNATAVWAKHGGIPGEPSLWTAGTGLKVDPPKVSVRRDYVGRDGLVDLFAQKATGELKIYSGESAGTFNGAYSGGTWPASSLLIPFGDLNQDGVNDVLVRNADGELHAYLPYSGTVADPAGPKAKLGTDWNLYDTFATPGDLTGDGRDDLLARQSAYGDLYLFEQNAYGSFNTGVKIGSSWKPYTIISAGDLNGDHNGDLITKDAAGDLWRYDGNGASGFLSRVKIGNGWGIYDTVVGVGDLSRDGKADLVARDAAGALWRYDGNGAGGLLSRVKIGNGGWEAFKTLS